jgi:hypothetical protein
MGAPADLFRLRCRMPDLGQAWSPIHRQPAPRSGGSCIWPALSEMIDGADMQF